MIDRKKTGLGSDSSQAWGGNSTDRLLPWGWGTLGAWAPEVTRFER
jgi:hypothetical protein